MEAEKYLFLRENMVKICATLQSHSPSRVVITPAVPRASFLSKNNSDGMGLRKLSSLVATVLYHKLILPWELS